MRIYRSIAYDERNRGRFNGVTPGLADTDARADMRMRLQRDIAVLNTIRPASSKSA